MGTPAITRGDDCREVLQPLGWGNNGKGRVPDTSAQRGDPRQPSSQNSEEEVHPLLLTPGRLFLGVQKEVKTNGYPWHQQKLGCLWAKCASKFPE